MNSTVQKFVNNDCTVQCKDRSETQFVGKVLSLDSSGVVASYTSHGREFHVFIPVENLSYIERKVLND